MEMSDDRLISFLDEKINDTKNDLGARIDGVNSRLDRICNQPERCSERFASKDSIKRLTLAIGVVALLQFVLHGGKMFTSALAEVVGMIK